MVRPVRATIFPRWHNTVERCPRLDVGIRQFAALDAIDKIAGVGVLVCFLFPFGMDQLPLFVVDAVFMEPALPSPGARHSLCAVDRDAILGALQPVRIPEPLLIRDGALIVVPGNVLSIWGLLIVVEEELTAHSGYGGGRFDTHRT